jgi:hypothetical protein
MDSAEDVRDENITVWTFTHQDVRFWNWHCTVCDTYGTGLRQNQAYLSLLAATEALLDHVRTTHFDGARPWLPTETVVDAKTFEELLGDDERMYQDALAHIERLREALRRVLGGPSLTLEEWEHFRELAHLDGVDHD